MLKYINNMKFNSYEDLIENFHLDIPDNFNFAYDIFDKIADEAPDRLAMVWCDDNGTEKRFTFGELREQCDRTANYLASLGIGKGDPVMLILKGRYEFRFCFLALHKLGAICIPATQLLTTKDIVYRNIDADIKMVISVDEDQVIQHVDVSVASSPSLQHKLMLGGSREGWLDFYQGINRSASHNKPDLKNMTTKDDIL